MKYDKTDFPLVPVSPINQHDKIVQTIIQHITISFSFEFSRFENEQQDTAKPLAGGWEEEFETGVMIILSITSFHKSLHLLLVLLVVIIIVLITSCHKSLH